MIKWISDQLFFFISDNLILTEDHKTVKLADFGLAREESLTEMMTAETGTYRWMAPEVLLNCQKLNNLLIFSLVVHVSNLQFHSCLVTALQHCHSKTRGEEALQP